MIRDPPYFLEFFNVVKIFRFMPVITNAGKNYTDRNPSLEADSSSDCHEVRRLL
jgi:hypothetical protein